MARTNASYVIALLRPGRDYDGQSDVAPFIASATAVVDRVDACATDKGVTLSSTELELIERWLAAHFYKSSDRQEQSKRTMSAAATFGGKTGLNLDGTTYGQTAMVLDPSGCLAAVGSGERKRASCFWAGRRPSEQTDYRNRD